MKEISEAIRQCIKAERESEAYWFKLRPKLSVLALEEGGRTPLEKVAFTLHYFYVDNDNDVNDAPYEIVDGIIVYLSKKGFKLKKLEDMYKKLKEAFKAKKAAKVIEGILKEHIQRSEEHTSELQSPT